MRRLHQTPGPAHFTAKNAKSAKDAKQYSNSLRSLCPSRLGGQETPRRQRLHQGGIMRPHEPKDRRYREDDLIIIKAGR